MYYDKRHLNNEDGDERLTGCHYDLQRLNSAEAEPQRSEGVAIGWSVWLGVMLLGLPLREYSHTTQ
ncbi:hypothetical protein [Sinimarinibacterium flocculans]|uniref:hypothetical protein n=1 Tax=Sinimarinibacterium flocculans TaxID=985250 RepID=UPI003512975B